VSAASKGDVLKQRAATAPASQPADDAHIVSLMKRCIEVLGTIWKEVDLGRENSGNSEGRTSFLPG
jgi:hypothetical protein